MRVLGFALGCFRRLAFASGAAVLLVSPIGSAIAKPSWSCECKTYSGSSENCHMFASISGKTFSFGAFETLGEGRYAVSTTRKEFVVKSRIKTQTGARLSVVIVQRRINGHSRVYVDRRAGQPTFTAQCAGTLPRR